MAEDMDDIVAVRAKELYDTCDIEGKGYITKKDMKRLGALLSLNQEQLEAVFDSLDDDQNGQLTLQEFTDGFGQFIVGDVKNTRRKRNSSIFYDGDSGFDGHGMKFRESLHSFSQTGVERESVSDLYEKLKSKHQDLLPGFENLLSKLTQEIQKSHVNVKKMETTIAQQATQHEERIQNIYNDLESQIKAEEKRLLNEEKQREKQIKEELELEIAIKDKLYRELQLKHEETKQRLQEISHQTGETQTEVDRLAEEQDMLEEALEETELNLEENKKVLEELRSKFNEEKRQRAANVGTVSMGISSERDQLISQLEQLKEINKRLKDERDANLMHSTETSRSVSPLGEILNFSDRPAVNNYEPSDDSDTNEPQNANVDIRRLKFHEASQLFGESMSILETSIYGESLDDDDGIEIDEEPATISEEPLEYRALCRASLTTNDVRVMESVFEPPDLTEAEVQTEIDITEREEPEKQCIDIQFKLVFSENDIPDSVFKVVMVGDTNVGKTAILDRFCNGKFSGDYAQTVGVDFLLKSIAVENHSIALQIWDTAGQERFQAITKQFYRKADGVVLVYDVMEHGTFMNLNKWMENVENNTNDEVMLMVLGNKTDLSKTQTKAIPSKNASELSRKYGALWFEVSALTGENVNEAFATLSKILKARLDKEMTDAIQLTGKEKSKPCCCKPSERASKRTAIIDSKTNYK